MRKITIVGIDDEYPALEFIEKCCAQLDTVELLRTFQNPEEALDFLNKNKVDLIILDINMPYLNGIEMLEKLTHKPLCIFFTLETQHAVKAFELDVIHYLVKPIDCETFEKAIQKAYEYFQFKESMSESNVPDYIMFKSNYVMNKVFLKDILWIEGFGEYIQLHTTYKKYIILERMSNFVDLHQHLGFVRIHKSFIVLKDHIESYSTTTVNLNNKNKLPLGRTYKQFIKELL